MGRSRSWILPMQAFMVIALFNPYDLATQQGVYHFFALMFLLNLFAATQDIAPLAVRSLSYAERSFGTSVQVAGYRLGLIVGRLESAYANRVKAFDGSD